MADLTISRLLYGNFKMSCIQNYKAWAVRWNDNKFDTGDRKAEYNQKLYTFATTRLGGAEPPRSSQLRSPYRHSSEPLELRSHKYNHYSPIVPSAPSLRSLHS